MITRSDCVNHPVSLILLDSKPNRHSLNALVGALETDPELDEVELRLAPGEGQLEQYLAEVHRAGRRPVVGISFTTWQASHIGDMLRRVRRKSPAPAAGPASDVGLARPGGAASPLWIAGGPHPTADPHGTLTMGFDAVVCGEGEAALLDLLKTATAGGDVGGVPGVAAGGPSGEVRPVRRSQPIDLDAYPPFPLRRRRVVGPIEITRGCPFACAYCQTSHLLGPRPRHRSVETIVRYAAEIRRRGLHDVRVVSPDAFAYGSPDGRTLNLPALESLLSALREVLGREGRLFFGTFPSEVRPEHVTDAALELVKRFADNDTLILGAQSASPRMLDLCHRGHTVADVFAAVSRTLAAGLKPHVDFIFGLPGETDEDLNETIAAIRQLAAMGATIHAHNFMPLPQTAFADRPPGRIHGRLRPIIKELIRQGSLYGVWHKQANPTSTR